MPGGRGLATLEVLTQKLFMDIGQVKDIFAHARDWGAGFFESPV